MRILILGASGLIGRMVFSYFKLNANYELIGVSKSIFISSSLNSITIKPFDFYKNINRIIDLIDTIEPDVVINCSGITKHNHQYTNEKKVIYLNSLLPKVIAKHCRSKITRFIQVSTDCVFSGKKGFYKEDDLPDGSDLYSKTKIKGELDAKYLTLRLSVIGPELTTKNGLFAWFMSIKNNNCIGFKKAYFSGITTLEFAKILKEIIIPNKNLKGIYHVSTYRISKFNLLILLSKIFNKKIKIEIDNNYFIDRTLLSDKFIVETGYKQKKYTTQLKELYLFMKQNSLHS